MNKETTTESKTTLTNEHYRAVVLQRNDKIVKLNLFIKESEYITFFPEQRERLLDLRDIVEELISHIDTEEEL